MKYIGWIVIGIIGLVVLGVGARLLRVVFLPVRVIDRSIQTAEGVVNKTLNADNAIYNYEWFKQQLEDIKANKNKVEIAEKATEQFKLDAGERTNWTFEDKTEYSRLQSVAQGLRSQTEDLIATYNARSKMANRNIFEDGKIPAVLEWGSSFLK